MGCEGGDKSRIKWNRIRYSEVITDINAIITDREIAKFVYDIVNILQLHNYTKYLKSNMTIKEDFCEHDIKFNTMSHMWSILMWKR